MGAHRPRRRHQGRAELSDGNRRGDGAVEGRRPVFHGRRLGRPLRAGRRKLVDEVLPRLSVDPEALRRGHPRTLFEPPARELWMEIGFGAGEHLAAQARANPDIGFLGCEPFLNGVATLLAEISGQTGRTPIPNIRLFADDVRLLLPALPDGALARVFVLFPDPWPKTRHHRRRLVNPESLREFARLIPEGGELRLASDHDGYVRWMLFHVLACGAFDWLARGPRDWREPPVDWRETRYEGKAARQGVRSAYLNFRRNARPAPAPAL